MSPITHVAFLMPSAGWGGIERKNVHFANELARRGIRVDMLLSRSETPPYQDYLNESVHVRPLGARHKYSAVPKVKAYLDSEQPDVLITAKDHGAKVGIVAGRLSRAHTKIVLGIGNTLGTSETKLGRRLGVRLLYRLADRIIANSQGVADDLVESFGLPGKKVRVVFNPVVTDNLLDRCREPVDHPWLQGGRDFTTVLGCGRLSPQKDFPTLLRALAEVRMHRDCRLVVLGEGPERGNLRALAERLGITDAVDFPGFVDNSYAYMARTDLFVLSSRWEGLPNVLIEALACGAPCVATDCPSGPREILREGQYGRLVPMGDAQEMATAIGEGLDSPTPPAILREAADRFKAEAATDHLLEVLGEVAAPASPATVSSRTSADE
ncbi:glycosyltransferase [Thiohalorhabdus sp. Cl-TMA]|uniref:Glycosyltransferase n=1 Tax=Thiohalorhabdus methylotrophus TaxID=3242694 RepID=A0ABV4TTF4_9GAMM